MKNKGILATLLSLLLALTGFFLPPASAQTEDAAGAPKLPREGSSFVVYKDESGETVCRVATPAEMRALLSRRVADDRRVIYSGGGRRLARDSEVAPLAGETGTEAFLLPSAGLEIVLRGTPQLEQNQTAKQAFIVAANRWEAVISTPITVVIDVDFGTTLFGTPFSSPSILGATGTDEVVDTLSDVRQRLLANSPTSGEAQLYQTLPTDSVKTEFNNSTFNSATVRMTVANGRALGIIPNSTSASPSDAGIGFNSAHPFDFNPDDGIDSDKTDFDAVATHEIGHALGFVSESGGPVYASVSMLDLFRFRSGAGTLGTFASASRVMSAGGTQVFFDNHTNTFGTLELRLSTGGPGGNAPGGDGRQSSHWKDDTPGFPHIGIMDPTIPDGRREVINNNDLRAFDSMGYSIGSPVPPPPPPPSAPPPPSNNAFANAAVITGASGFTTGNSTGATRESGEPVHPSSPGGRSVWYRWTAPASGNAVIETQGSGYDTILAVYTGSSLGGLTQLGANDDLATGQTTASRVTFSATAGTVYQIQIDGFNNGAGPEFGIIQLNWSVAQTSTNPGTLQFSSPTFAAPESVGQAQVTVTRTGGSDGAVGVSFATSNGTATAGSDYAATVGTLTFAAGETSKTLNIFVNSDLLFEPDETVNLTLSAPTGGATLGTQSTTSLIIVNDDAAPAFVVNDLTQAEGNAGTTLFNFTVTKFGQTALPASVVFSTDNGTATAGSDYAASSGTLNFAAVETTKTVTVQVNGDTAVEGNETFFVNLQSATGASVADAQGLGTITNDDTATAATVQFSAAAQSVGEAGLSAAVTVTRTDTSGAASVDYATGGGTADGKKDYTLALGRLDFAAGEASKTITVLVTDDVFAEGAETLNVTLSNPVNVNLGTPSTAVVTITDNDAVTGANPVQAPSFNANFFVRQQYLDFFSREPDAPGLAHWTGVVSGCEPTTPCGEVLRINVSGAFFLSIEFEQTGYLIERTYKAAYGDATGTSTLNGPHTLTVPIIRHNEFLFDAQRIGRDVIVNQGNWEAQLEANKQAYFLEFVQRQRFIDAFPASLTPTDFVDRLNGRAGNPLDATERQNLINELTANNTTAGRASVLRKVAEDPTLFAAERNRAFVLMQYFGYLRRDPNSGQDTDYTGYDFWLGNLNTFNGNFVQAELVKAFITSTEYQARFGPTN